MAVLLGEKNRFSKIEEPEDEHRSPIGGDSIRILDPNSEPSVDEQLHLISDCCCSSPQDSDIEEVQSGSDKSCSKAIIEPENDKRRQIGHIEDDQSEQNQKSGKYFYYDSPLYEETGIWIPISVPPMTERNYEEWSMGLRFDGAYFPEGELGWDQLIEKNKEMTMWDVVAEMLLMAKGKVNDLAKGDITHCLTSLVSSSLLEQSWKEVGQTLNDAHLSNKNEVLNVEPPRWLADSVASACMLCNVQFHPIMCSRHHCRFCGGIFCSECSKGRSLMPPKFHTTDPQRVCDVCSVKLFTVQPYLMNRVSRASQLPTHDLTDLSTLRSWLNFPWGQSMEYEIYKATNIICGYDKVGRLRPEKSIPQAILRQAEGFAILSAVNVGVMVTYNVGTGLVIARRDDGSWSPPCAISSFGVGWGPQVGGQLTDFIIVLRNKDAVKTFSGNSHFSVGASLNAAAGIVGRTAKADFHAGGNGYGACYTYSSSKGAFVGCSLEGSIIITRMSVNAQFYGSTSLVGSDILLGDLPRPPAASILYNALSDMQLKREI